MKYPFLVLYLLFAITLCKERGIEDVEGKSKGDKETNKKSSSESDESDSSDIENECCSKSDPNCCISLTYISSETKQEEVPDEFGGTYYCEYFDITKTGECGNLDSIFLPISKWCDFTRVIWKLQWISDKTEDCAGFIRAQSLADGEIVLNNADDFLLSPDHTDNPTGYHALRFPIDSDGWSKDKQSISICTQLESGDIVDNIDGKDIEIGFSMDDKDKFICSNSSVRDICSIDTSLATYDAETGPLNMVHLKQREEDMNGGDTVDDPRFDRFVNTFEFYWNQYVGFGIAVFAASIFFNMAMCVYWSGYKGDYNDNTMKKVIIDDDDDDTEEESDDTDESERDDEDV